MKRLRAVAALLAMTIGVSARAAPLDTVLAALATEERAPFERIRMFIQRGDVADVYYIDRVRPDRTRLQKNPRQGGMDMIVIGNQQWLGTGTGWQKSTAPALPAGITPPMAEMFRQGLTTATETPQADGSRIVEGTMRWSGAASCTGQMHMAIDPAGRPALLRFEGGCNGKPARFRQAFAYPERLSIDPP